MALDFSNAGYIYILTNESLGNLVKVGYTKNSPEERAKQLFTTGVPTPYRVWSFDFVENAEAVEEAVHVALFKNRSNRDREFFNISPDEAKKTVDRIIHEQREQFLKHGQKEKNQQYSNPKFVEAIKVLKENEGNLFSDKDLSRALKVSEKGVGQIIYMLESQETPVLYTNPDPNHDKKYGIYVKFGKEQLNILENKYPNLDFSEVKPLFEDKPKYNKKQRQQSSGDPSEQKRSNPRNNKESFNPLNYENPKLIELLRVLKENQGKPLMNCDEIAQKINEEPDLNGGTSKISGKGVRQIVSILELNQVDVMFIVPKTDKKPERFGLDFNFDKNKLEELDKAYPKMNLSQLEPLFEKQKKKQKQRRKHIEKDLKSDDLEKQVQKIQKSGYQKETTPKPNEPKSESVSQKEQKQKTDNEEQDKNDKRGKIKRTNIPAPNGGTKFFF